MAGAPMREQLRTAHDMLAGIGMEAFAERAPGLLATDETVGKRSGETVTTLTAQEALIAKLAGDGQPIRRSTPGCCCPRARSNGTCARSLPSSASVPAGNCTRP